MSGPRRRRATSAATSSTPPTASRSRSPAPASAPRWTSSSPAASSTSAGWRTRPSAASTGSRSTRRATDALSRSLAPLLTTFDQLQNPVSVYAKIPGLRATVTSTDSGGHGLRDGRDRGAARRDVRPDRDHATRARKPGGAGGVTLRQTVDVEGPARPRRGPHRRLDADLRLQRLGHARDDHRPRTARDRRRPGLRRRAASGRRDRFGAGVAPARILLGDPRPPVVACACT